MATAAFSGKQGQASFTGLTFEVLSFSATATCDHPDSTVMDVSAPAAGVHWKESVSGFKDWTATVEVRLPLGGIGLAALGTEAELILDFTVTGGRRLKGNAVLTNIGGSVSANDVSTASLSFQGTDELEQDAT